jgi:hypothetical protein
MEHEVVMMLFVGIGLLVAARFLRFPAYRRVAAAPQWVPRATGIRGDTRRSGSTQLPLDTLRQTRLRRAPAAAGDEDRGGAREDEGHRASPTADPEQNGSATDRKQPDGRRQP